MCPQNRKGRSKTSVGLLNGRYELLEVLGMGGFATVYRGRHLKMDRQVAIKILDFESDDNDICGLVEEKFFLEARSVSQLKHPNSVRIYDFGLTSARQPYIVMDLLEGHTLSEELRDKGAMSPERVRRLFLPCLRALAEVHALGIVHRDLKPGNLFLTAPGTRRERLILLDFGVACAREHNQDTSTTSIGRRLGTPRYMPPEYTLDNIVKPALDVYQIGQVLIEALTGEPILKHNDMELLTRDHATGSLKVPVDLMKGPLGAVLCQAMALNYRQRYQDAGALVEALSKVDFSRVATPGSSRDDLWRLSTPTSFVKETPTRRLRPKAARPPVRQHRPATPTALASATPLPELGFIDDSMDSMVTTLWEVGIEAPQKIFPNRWISLLVLILSFVLGFMAMRALMLSSL